MRDHEREHDLRISLYVDSSGGRGAPGPGPVTVGDAPSQIHVGRFDGLVAVDLVGRLDLDDVMGSAYTLASLAANLVESAESISSSVNDSVFETIVARELDPRPQGDGHEGDQEDAELPGWGQMGDLDRAVTLDYLETLLNGLGDEDTVPSPEESGLSLRYVQHEELRRLDAQGAHEHALDLQYHFHVLDALRPDERDRLRTIARANGA